MIWSFLILKFIDLMSHDTKIGIVTAAGYTEAERYYSRLHGLLEAIKASTNLSPAQKRNIIIMGKFHHTLVIVASNLQPIG